MHHSQKILLFDMFVYIIFFIPHSLQFTIIGEIFACDHFVSNCQGSHIPASWTICVKALDSPSANIFIHARAYNRASPWIQVEGNHVCKFTVS